MTDDEKEEFRQFALLQAKEHYHEMLEATGAPDNEVMRIGYFMTQIKAALDDKSFDEPELKLVIIEAFFSVLESMGDFITEAPEFNDIVILITKAMDNEEEK